MPSSVKIFLKAWVAEVYLDPWTWDIFSTWSCKILRKIKLGFRNYSVKKPWPSIEQSDASEIEKTEVVEVCSHSKRAKRRKQREYLHSNFHNVQRLNEEASQRTTEGASRRGIVAGIQVTHAPKMQWKKRKWTTQWLSFSSTYIVYYSLLC